MQRALGLRQRTGRLPQFLLPPPTVETFNSASALSHTRHFRHCNLAHPERLLPMVT